MPHPPVADILDVAPAGQRRIGVSRPLGIYRGGAEGDSPTRSTRELTLGREEQTAMKEGSLGVSGERAELQQFPAGLSGTYSGSGGRHVQGGRAFAMAHGHKGPLRAMHRRNGQSRTRAQTKGKGRSNQTYAKSATVRVRATTSERSRMRPRQVQQDHRGTSV